MIASEAITAAAKVIYADNISNYAGDNAPQIIAACERVAAKALAAAAPLLMAAAWDEAVSVLYRAEAISPDTMKAMIENNPHRPKAAA